MMEITFLGAAGCVTGSRSLVQQGQRRLLVDCGLFQGYKHLRERNWRPFPVDPATIDAVVLTHAHLDHSGYLPRLVREGFRGRIACTQATADLAQILLRDAAKLQEEDARLANRAGFSRHKPAKPLYRLDDAEQAIRLLQPRPTEAEFNAGGMRVVLVPNGHILGSCAVRIGSGGTSATFSGDVGRYDDLVMRPPQPPPPASELVLESTYGGRLHGEMDAEETIAWALRRAEKEGEPILIPAFAIGRAQACILLLHRVMTAGRVPQLSIYLDSPMAREAQRALERHLAQTRITREEVRAAMRRTRIVSDRSDSMFLAKRRGAHVLVSASGMLTGGRVLNHFKAVAPRQGATILLAGYQAGGTRGARLAAGERRIKVHGRWIDVQAQVERLDNLSAHADADALVKWISSMQRAPRHVSLVHGEPEQADALRMRIKDELGIPAAVAMDGQRIHIEAKG